VISIKSLMETEFQDVATAGAPSCGIKVNHGPIQNLQWLSCCSHLLTIPFSPFSQSPTPRLSTDDEERLKVVVQLPAGPHIRGRSTTASAMVSAELFRYFLHHIHVLLSQILSIYIHR
jgi:hypothetical protein